MPPVNNINVGLGLLGKTPVLDVEDNGGQNKVKRDPQPTTIVWKLVGQLNGGSFADMGGTDPGFQWVQQPPEGLFGDPELLPNGKLQIVDKYSDVKNKGEWIYKLRVVYNNKIYTTLSSLEVRPGATVKDPVIINKDP